MILFLSNADTELLALRTILHRLPDGFPTVRAADPTALDGAPELDDVELVVVRLLGGRAAWEAPFDALRDACGAGDVPLVAVGGEAAVDPELAGLSTVPTNIATEAHRYLAAGGPENLAQLLRFLADTVLLTGFGFDAPAPVPMVGVWGGAGIGAPDATRDPGRPLAGVIFYRAHLLAGNTQFVADLCAALERRGADALAVFTYSLRPDADGAVPALDLCRDHAVDVLVTGLRAMGSSPTSRSAQNEQGDEDGGEWEVPALAALGVPVVQAPPCNRSRDEWIDDDAGLSPLDVATGVAIPEFDGRIVGPAFSFKEQVDDGGDLGTPVVAARTDPERTDRVAGLAVRLAQLRHTPAGDKRVALVLSAYPTKRSRLGNAVGLDTPASVVRLLHALRDAGYRVERPSDDTSNRPTEPATATEAGATMSPQRESTTADGHDGDAVSSLRPPSGDRDAETTSPARSLPGDSWRGAAPSEDIPADGDALMAELVDRFTYEQPRLRPDQVERAVGRLDADDYAAWFATLPDDAREMVEAVWGEAPGEVYVADGPPGEAATVFEDLPHDSGGRSSKSAGPRALHFPGLDLGNVLVTIQPPRGFGSDPIGTYHAPDVPPPHHYLAFYRWLTSPDGWGADAVVHMGKHGTLEWLPGKANALSAGCFPDAALGDTPFVYPFVVNDPGEGTQAKRRTHAVVVDHLVPPMTRADSYDELARLEQLLDTYAQAQAMDPAKLPALRRQVWDLLVDAEIHRDLDLGEAPDGDAFDDLLLHVDGYLCALKDAQIRGGLHILGAPPEGEALVDLVLAVTRLPQGTVPSLRQAVADELAVDLTAGRRTEIDRVESACRAIVESLAANDWTAPNPVLGTGSRAPARDPVPRTKEGAGVNATEDDPSEPVLLAALGAGAPKAANRTDGRSKVKEASAGESAIERVERWVCERLVPNLRSTTDEVTNLLAALDGRYVPAGASGAPTRGAANVLPTGRNFYSVDPKALPSPLAWDVGTKLADALVERHVAETGEPPRTVGLVLWGTAAMRTGGDDAAQALALLGVQPTWEPESGRVTGLRVIPLDELGRPRVDVTLRISGFFRDAFPHLVALLDDAVRLVAGRDDEPVDQNPLRAPGAGDDPRIWGPPPGGYGSGILPVIESGAWRSDADLAAVYLAWSGFAYGRDRFGEADPDAMRRRFAVIDVAVKNQDNREHDIFDSDDYLQDHGGMVAAVRALSGRAPRAWFGDTADPSRPQVRSLAEEAARVVRSRVLNPRWIDAMRRHGYKGAFELAATVDYLFGYDATAQVVEDWMYERVTERYVGDAAMRDFFARSNPAALRAIAERLLEANRRGMWSATESAQKTLVSAVLEAEGWEESGA